MELGSPCYTELWLDAIEMGDLAYVRARMGPDGILIVSHLADVGRKWTHYVWDEVEWKHLFLNVWDMHHKCEHVFKTEDVIKLTRVGMNELMYDFVLRGI